MTIKIIVIICVCILSGCVTTPSYFNKSYTNWFYTLNSLPSPSEDESLLKLDSGYSENVVVEVFDGKVLDKSKKSMMAMTFPHGYHRIKVGLFGKRGELNLYPLNISGTIHLYAEPGKTYKIDFEKFGPDGPYFLLSEEVSRVEKNPISTSKDKPNECFGKPCKPPMGEGKD